jgi:intracellular septation protein
MNAQAKPPINPALKLALDLGPLILFFVAYGRADLFVATAVFMVATVVALGVGYALTRHVPLMPLASAVIVVVMGSLTLILHNETFIKMKPTIVYTLFGVVLLGGQLMGKPLLAMVFDQVLHINDEGWRKLTIRWSLFFFALAILNEIIWRTQSTDTWVAFKAFGFLPVTLIFAALQYPLIQKYAVKETEA